jgi:hypothetical protein
MEFSSHGIRLALKEFGILEHFGLHIFGLGTLTPYNDDCIGNKRMVVVRGIAVVERIVTLEVTVPGVLAASKRISDKYCIVPASPWNGQGH